MLVLMLLVIAVLLVRVLPIFDDVYASLGGRLTGVAGGLLALGRGLDAAMPVLWVVLAADSVFTWALLARRHDTNLLALRAAFGQTRASSQSSTSAYTSPLLISLSISCRPPG